MLLALRLGYKQHARGEGATEGVMQRWLRHLCRARCATPPPRSDAALVVGADSGRRVRAREGGSSQVHGPGRRGYLRVFPQFLPHSRGAVWKQLEPALRPLPLAPTSRGPKRFLLKFHGRSWYI